MSIALRDAASVLAMLPDDAQLTITVRKADLLRALEQRDAAAPANLDTTQASQRFGYTGERWRRWAEAGKIAGAWQDARGGSWHLPFSACEAHVRELQRRGRATVVRGAGVQPSSRSVPRGPRRPRPQRQPVSTNPVATTISLEAARAARP